MSRPNARAHLERGLAAQREGDEPLARKCFTQGLRLARRHRDARGIAEALVELAGISAGHERWRQKRRCEEARTLFRDLGDVGGEARAVRMLSLFVPPPDSTRLREESLALARAAGDPREIVAALLVLAPRSEGCKLTLTEEASSVSRESGDRTGQAAALCQLALMCHRDDPSGSREAIDAAMAIYREQGHKPAIVSCLRILAMVHPEEEGKIAAYHECRALCRAMGWLHHEIIILEQLADVLAGRGEDAQARSLRREAAALWLPEDEQITREIEEEIKPLPLEEARRRVERLLKRGRGLRASEMALPEEERTELQSLAPLLRELFERYWRIAPRHFECASLIRPTTELEAPRPPTLPGLVDIGNEYWGPPRRVVVKPHDETIYYLEETEEGGEARLVDSGYRSIYHYLLSLRYRFS